MGAECRLRLDHLLVSPALAERLADAGVDRAIRGIESASDHAPAWIKLRLRSILKHSLKTAIFPSYGGMEGRVLSDSSELIAEVARGRIGELPGWAPPSRYCNGCSDGTCDHSEPNRGVCPGPHVSVFNRVSVPITTLDILPTN